MITFFLASISLTVIFLMLRRNKILLNDIDSLTKEKNSLLENKTLEESKIESLNFEIKKIQEGHQQSDKQNFLSAGTLHDMGNVLNGLNFKIHGINRIAFNNKYKEIKRAIDLLKDPNLGEEKKLRTYEFIDLLVEEFSKDKEKSKKLSSDAQRLIKHMIEIIDLRQHRKSSFHKEDGANNGININEIIHSAILINEYLIQGNNINVQLQIQDFENLNLNPSILLDVLANLVKNACEAIIGHPQSSRILEIKAHKDSSSLVFNVIDSGIGMDQKTLDKVFQGNFTTKEYGLGVGLIHSKSQIESLGGVLRAQSVGVGHGSVFTITLPI